MLLSFLVVFVVLAKYGFPVIVKMVEERKAYIDHSMEVAREANEKFSKIKEETEALIASANKEQGRIVREAMQERERIIADARKQARKNWTKCGNKYSRRKRRLSVISVVRWPCCPWTSPKK